jgi:hypothetical protein
MRKILLSSLILLITLPIFSASSFEITKEWIQIKQKSRSYFDKRRLLELDTETLKDIESKSFSPDVEPYLADLLYDIIVYDKLDSNENCFKAFDILENNFKDKQHLCNVASEFANYYNTGYPFIIAKIFKSLKNTITDNYDGNVEALSKIYEFIKTPYIVEAQNGTVRYGSNTVLKFLKEYLLEFQKLLSEGKISNEPEKLDIIIRISAEIGL